MHENKIILYNIKIKEWVRHKLILKANWSFMCLKILINKNTSLFFNELNISKKTRNGVLDKYYFAEIEKWKKKREC